MMELSKRLLAVAGLVTEKNTVCDVGCDHGYVPVYLVQEGISPKVIAMDVNKGPLERAREHIACSKLGAYIETRLSDGLAALLKGEAQTLIIAGMGGRLMVRILEEGWEKAASMEELILQPQSDIAFVRQFLRKKGFAATAEDMVLEDGKYYPMMKVKPEAVRTKQERICPVFLQADKSRETAETKETVELQEAQETAELQEAQEMAELWQKAWDAYGEYLLREKHPVLYAYLRWEQARRQKILDGLEQALTLEASVRLEQRRKELQEEVRVNRLALSCYGKEYALQGID